jgi:hypothetical protein
VPSPGAAPSATRPGFAATLPCGSGRAVCPTPRTGLRRPARMRRGIRGASFGHGRGEVVGQLVATFCGSCAVGSDRSPCSRTAPTAACRALPPSMLTTIGLLVSRPRMRSPTSSSVTTVGSPYSLRQGQWVLGVPSMPTPITTAQVIAESSTRPSPARPLAWLSARRAISVAAANRREIANLLVEVAARGSPCQRRRVRRYRWTYRYVHRAAQPRRLVVSRNTQVDRHCDPYSAR